MYKLTETTSIQRLVDGAIIPADDNNTDYRIYLQWVVEGNTPEPFDTRTDDEKLDEWRKNMSVRASAIRLALLEQDLLDEVETAIKSAPRAMQIKWEFEVTIKRLDSDLVNFAKSQLDMTDIQIDNLFELAKTK